MLRIITIFYHLLSSRHYPAC